MRTVEVGEIKIGGENPLVLIAGPCVIEGEGLTLQVAREIKRIAGRLGMPFIFKASYRKANRTSVDSYQGPGLEEGLKILARVREGVGVPVLSDVHGVEEVGPASSVLDVIQIPAFLCRQTDLVQAVARTGKPMNIKKGQFLAPDDVEFILEKARSAGNDRIMVTERGTVFGYHDLVVDMRGLVIMAEMGYPVVFDVTHSVQKPGGGQGGSGGDPRFIFPLARSAVATGAVSALFIETHPSPDKAKSDAASMLHLNQLESLLTQVQTIYNRVPFQQNKTNLNLK
ncbi:3-deoxy-8-phosphooctulonate synthase [candidate division KSB1 bacterium]|nr:3-deoxy-8-phosphooctulonate synthase [candidate division KSB1 bacterium]